MRRRTFLAGLAATAAAGAIGLTACGNGGNGASGSSAAGSLDFFHRWPTEPKNGYFEWLISKFTQETGISVAVDKVLNDTYKDKVRVSVGSAQSPDVFFSWSGSFASSLVDTGNVLELDDLLASDSALKDSFYANQLPPFQVGGKQVGLPIGMIGKYMFLNSEMFAQHGWTAPETWPDFLSLLQDIQGTGVVPLAYGAQDQWTIAHYVGTLNQRIVDPLVIERDYAPATGEFTDPGYVEALQMFQDLQPYMTPNVAATSHQQARDSWLAGQAAIFFAETAEYQYITNGLQWETFNFPSIPNGKGDQHQLMGAPEGFMIAANSDNMAGAQELIKFLFAKDNAVEWVNQTGELSPVKDAVAESNATDAVKAMAVAVSETSAMTPWLDNALDQQLVDTYMAETQLMLAGERSPEQVMVAVQETAKRVAG